MYFVCQQVKQVKANNRKNKEHPEVRSSPRGSTGLGTLDNRYSMAENDMKVSLTSEYFAES